VSKTPAKPAAPAAKKAPAKAAPAKPAAKPAAKAAAKPAPAKAPAKAAAPAAKPVPKTPPKATVAPVTKPAPPAPELPKPAAKPAAKARAAARPTPAELAEPAVRTVPLPPPSRPPASNVIDLPRPVRKIDPKLANVWKTKAGRDLTEDELLSMPDSEYMNDKQLEFFRTRLMQQRNDLLENAGETTEHLREDTSIVPDPADRATIEEEHALELRTRDRERKLLKKISQSIARIEAGDYGYCDETGEPIGLGRLLARPTATLSLEAQQRRELKQKMFGD
jgi:DnaK suppressor protein